MVAKYRISGAIRDQTVSQIVCIYRCYFFVREVYKKEAIKILFDDKSDKTSTTKQQHAFENDSQTEYYRRTS